MACFARRNKENEPGGTMLKQRTSIAVSWLIIALGLGGPAAAQDDLIGGLGPRFDLAFKGGLTTLPSGLGAGFQEMQGGIKDFVVPGRDWVKTHGFSLGGELPVGFAAFPEGRSALFTRLDYSFGRARTTGSAFSGTDLNLGMAYLQPVNGLDGFITGFFPGYTFEGRSKAKLEIASLAIGYEERIPVAAVPGLTVDYEVALLLECLRQSYRMNGSLTGLGFEAEQKTRVKLYDKYVGPRLGLGGSIELGPRVTFGLGGWVNPAVRIGDYRAWQRTTATLLPPFDNVEQSLRRSETGFALNVGATASLSVEVAPNTEIGLLAQYVHRGGMGAIDLQPTPQGTAPGFTLRSSDSFEGVLRASRQF